MMRRKSSEEIQAQIAAFASKHVEDTKDFRHVMENIGDLAEHGPKDVEKVAEEDGYVRKDGKYVKETKGTKRTVASAEEYLKFLRASGGPEQESIQGRIHMLKEYEVFSSDIKKLKNELLSSETMSEHPAFLGSGSNALVFFVENGGKRYAVRVPRGESIKPAQVDEHLAGAVLGRGIPHLEQIVAASYEDGVTVAEMMPGKEIGQLETEDIAHVSEAQIAEFVDTLVAANGRGITIDPKPSNFFYDPNVGFGIVDFSSSEIKSGGAKKQELGGIVGGCLTAFTGAGLYGRQSNPIPSEDDFGRNLKVNEANLRNLEAYRRIVESKLVEPDQKNALAVIDRELAKRQEMTRDLANPIWVAKEIERATESEKKRIEMVEARRKQKESGKPDDVSIPGWDLV